MKKIVYLTILLSFAINQIYSESWSGTSTTNGNTTQHKFRKDGIQVIPARQSSSNNNTTAAYVGGAAIGVCLGIVLVKAFQYFTGSSKNKYEDYKDKVDFYLQGYTYENHTYFINVIYYSELPSGVKQYVIDNMNYYYKVNYLDIK